MSDNTLSAVIESILFASERPVTIDQLRKALDNLDSAEIRKHVEILRDECVALKRGVHIAEIAGGYQMVTSPDYAQFLKKFFKDRNTEKLSKPALETLAIIAYKQPITRGEIESLRSVNVDGVMKSLTDKNLIRITGRKKVPGSPFVYGTTRQFLEYFGLRNLEDLPKLPDFPTLAAEPANSQDEIEPLLRNEVEQRQETENQTDTQTKNQNETENQNEAGVVAQEN